MLDLRDYQHSAIAELRRHFGAGARRVLLLAPTGAGKTVMAAEVMRGAVQLGHRVLFLAHRGELLDQTRAKLTDIGVYSGIIQAGRHADALAKVQVASIQTAIRREPPPANLVIVDEAHHTSADSYRAILARYPEAWILGLTATPIRIDGKGLRNDFDELVIAAEPAELTRQGFLVPCDVFAYTQPDLKGIRTRGGDFVTKMLELAVDKQEIIGSIVKEYRTHADGRPAIVFPVSIAHSQHLVAQFTAAGYSAAHLDCDMAAGDRRELLERFRSGSLTILSSVGVLTEGFDAPRAEVCILARPTMSEGRYLQMVGRVLRPFPGKSKALVHDHAGNGIRFGLPTDKRNWSLTEDRPKRPKPTHHTCPMCFAVVPVTDVVCSACGETIRIVEVRERRQQRERTGGSIQRVNLEDLRQQRERDGLAELTASDMVRVASCSRIRAAQEWLRLIHLCRWKGWSERFAVKLYREVFGKGPDFKPVELAGLEPADRPLVMPIRRRNAA